MITLKAEEIEKLNQNLIKASQLINAKNFPKAKEILHDYLQVTEELVKSSKKTKMLCFDNLVEFYAYTKNETSKNINWVSFRCDVAYQWLAYIANEEGKHKEALKYINKGLKYNPMNINLYFEQAETYKLTNENTKILDALYEAYFLIYSARDLARYYRLLGYFYTEQKIYEIAFALYMFSLEYENSPLAYSELDYILKTINNPNFRLSMPDIISLFLKNNINIGAPKENILILKELLEEKELIPNIEMQFDIYQNLFLLTKDDTYYHSLIIPLNEKRVDISDEYVLSLINVNDVISKIKKHKLKKYKIEYVIEHRTDSYQGYIILDDNNYIIEEYLEESCPYKIKMYGLYLNKEENGEYLELKIASKE